MRWIIFIKDVINYIKNYKYKKKGYICSIAFNMELEYTDVKIIHDQKLLNKCTNAECGIYEVEIVLKKIIQSQDLTRKPT